MTKITIISSYYYPEDTAVGLYNAQMVNYLEEKGYDVTVITGFPFYPQWRIRDSYIKKPTFFKEFIGKTLVLRYKQYVPANPNFIKRILQIIDFTFGGLINVFKVKECDIVISVVPYTSCTFLGWILKKRTKAILWNHIQDFEFDAALQTGVSSNPGILKSLLFKFLFRLETFLFNRAEINSTISFSMIDKLDKKSKKPSFYFPNWIDESKLTIEHQSKHPYLKSPKYKILYSGNIGDKQDWEFFIKFATKVNELDLAEIVIVGDGAKKEWLCAQLSKLENVSYFPPVKYEELSNLLCSADLHLLFQKNDVIDSVMPSKLLGMMGSSKPSLIKGNTTSEVKEIIESSQGGFYLVNESIDECIDRLKFLISKPQESIQMGINARTYILSKFSSQNVLALFTEKLETLF